MKKQLTRMLALLLAILLAVPTIPMTVSAATYRNGAQSGPSTSYKNGRYYQNYLRVPITGDNRTDLIAMALSQLGYQEGASTGMFSGEVSGRNNYVEFSYNMGDLGLGYGGSDYPWCASFVSWCLYQSRSTDQGTYQSLGRFHVGDYKYIWKEISCSQWVRQLKGAGYYKYSAYEGGTYTPKSGDLVFFQNSGGVAHIGICLYTKNGRIYTVEGNTSDSSGLEANGGGVYFKNYLLTTSYINGYGVLPYKTNSSVAKIDYSGANPTPGLYVANAAKYIYGSETDTTYDYVMNRFTMFEVTEVCSNGRLKGIFKEKNGSTVTGYIINNSDRVIQLSSSEKTVSAADLAREELKKVIASVDGLRHYNYAEDTIFAIRSAYNNAVSVLNNASATETQLKNAASSLNSLMTQTGTNTIGVNNEGIYINGRHGVIKAGDCFIYSNLWNNGLITVDNANIRYTVNVVCGWDYDQQMNVVKSISVGTGNATPAIQLGESEFLIACHNWETGVSAADGPVEYSGTNYKILSELEIGANVFLSGATALNTGTTVEPAAYLKFASPDAPHITGRNEYVDAGEVVLFTTEFNSGLLTHANANIHQTLNVLAQWDDSKSAWIVVNKFRGTGAADESSNIELADGQVLIAGLSTDALGSAANYEKLNNADVGEMVIFSGLSPDTGKTAMSIAANVDFTAYTAQTSAAVNLALNKDMQVQAVEGSGYTADLNDGIYTDALSFDGNWFAFKKVNGNTADGVGTLVVDLGQRYNLGKIRAHLAPPSEETSIGHPTYVEVYVSNDDVNYRFAGNLNVDLTTADAQWATLKDAGVVGRFVKLVVGPGVNYCNWVFLNEIEVYGTELTGEENIAWNTSYEIPAPDGYNTSLTDGVAADELDTNAWYGFTAANTADGVGTVVLDLGGRYKVYDVAAHLFAGENSVSAAQPGSVAVSVSADGTNYIKVGDLALDDTAAAPYWAALGQDSVVGQYVKLEVSCAAALTLLNEIQVYGVPYNQTRDSNVALGKDYTAISYDGSPFNAALTDGVATDIFQYNVNNSSWFGFRNTGSAGSGNVNLDNNRGIITIDLAGQAEITGVSAHLFAGDNDAGASQASYVNVYYSADGVAYDYLGTMTPGTAASAPFWAGVDCSAAPIHARYIKLAVGVNSGCLTLLNEVKVDGIMLTSEETAEPGSMSTVTLAGSFNSWNATPNMVINDDGRVKATLTLEPGPHEFKILYGNKWFGNNGTIVDTTTASSDIGWEMTEGSNNCILQATGGEYTFLFDTSSKLLVVLHGPCDHPSHSTDGTCSQCGANAGHRHEAVVTAPTCEAGGYTTYTCSCGDTYTADEVEALGHSYENGVCVNCGEADPDYNPVVIPTVKPAGFTLSFEDEILVNLYFTVSDTTSVTQQGMLVFHTDPGEADIEKANAVYPGSEASGSFIATTAGIAAKEMGDERYYCAYAKLSDGTYIYSTVHQYSPKKYAVNLLGRASTSEKQKALCVAMLNYGAAAQEYFAYRTEDLMNAGLTAEQKALVVSYDASLFRGAVKADASKVGSFAATGGFAGMSASVSFEGAFAINYYFLPGSTVDGDMKLYIWNPEAYAAAAALTADNASEVLSMELQSSGAYWGQVDGIAAKSLDDTYYVAGVYTDENGNTCSTGVIAYSLSTYCLNNAKPGKQMENLAAATAMYGYYAKQYFSN